jgi:hypothetical protein
MSYNSDVMLCAEPNIAKKFLEANKLYGLFKDVKTLPDGSAIFKQNCIKWYTNWNYESVEAFMDIMQTADNLDEDDLDGNRYKFLRIGESDQDNETSTNDNNDESFPDYYITRSFAEP